MKPKIINCVTIISVISLMTFELTRKMNHLKLILVVSCVCLLSLSSVAVGARIEREVEAPKENDQVGKVQQQLMTAFDSLKKSMEELASKFNTDDFVQGVQNITAKLEDYAKQAADQFASTASGTTGTSETETKKEESS